MQHVARRLALHVENPWGLTRRRALDFGRMTADS
jgi:hypothetical protein